MTVEDFAITAKVLYHGRGTPPVEDSSLDAVNTDVNVAWQDRLGDSATEAQSARLTEVNEDITKMGC